MLHICPPAHLRQEFPAMARNEGHSLDDECGGCVAHAIGEGEAGKAWRDGGREGKREGGGGGEGEEGGTGRGGE